MRIVVVEGRLFLQYVQGGSFAGYGAVLAEFDLTEHIESTMRKVLRQEATWLVTSDGVGGGGGSGRRRESIEAEIERSRFAWLVRIYYRGSGSLEHTVFGLDEALGMVKSELERPDVDSVHIFRGGEGGSRVAA